MKKWMIAVLLAVAPTLTAQTAVLPIYACTLPGTQAQVSSLLSTNYQQGIIPSCTVTVYLTGTTTLATTSPQSPFTANANGSIPPIYSAINQGVDVVLSGGNAPNVYPAPVTFTGLFPAQQIVSAGVSQIIQGSNVTISPVGGTGAVTISATGGGGGGIGGSGTGGTLPIFTGTGASVTLGNSPVVYNGSILTSSAALVDSVSITAPVTNGHQTVGLATGSDNAQLSAAITAAGPNGTVDLTPGQKYVVNASLNLTKNYQIINFNGAAIECTLTSLDCIYVSGTGVTINQPVLIPGAADVGGAAIEDGGMALTINGGGVVQLHGNSPANGQYWYHIIQIDGDEVASLNNFNGQANVAVFGGLQPSAQAVTRCDSTYCGSGLYNPPSTSGIATLNNVALTMGCSGNSIDWEGGNTLYLNSVTMQSYNQYGMLVLKNGSGAGTVVGNGLYVSPTSCTGVIGTVGNPMLNGAQGGTAIVVGSGINITLNDSNPPGAGGNGVTAVTCTTSPCTESFGYYVVVHSGTSFTTVTRPMVLGVTGANVNASFTGSSVTVVSPTSPNSGDTCDFLAVDQTVNGQSGPVFAQTVNSYAITGEQGVACGPGAGTYVTFTDTGARSTYSWPSEPSYVPVPYNVNMGVNGWTAAAIILNGTDTGFSNYTGPCPTAGGIIRPSYSSTLGKPYITCTTPTLDGFSGNGYPSSATLVNRRSGFNAQTGAPSAILTPAWYANTGTGYKGLYNLGPNDSGWTWAGGPTDMFTLIDSNPWKTLGLPGNRPSWDGGDTAISVDNTNNGIALRDPYSVSSYASGTTADGANFQERLTASAKSLYVPTNVYGPLNVSQLTATPAINSTTSTTTGGTIPASTTRYYRIAGVMVGGYHSASSPEAQQTTGSSTNTNRNELNVTIPTGYPAYNVYIGTATNTEVGPCNATPITTYGNANTFDTGAACANSNPYPTTNTMPVSSFTLSGGTAMTANQGTGASVQHSTGTTTTNDCVKFDSAGNTIDAGSSCIQRVFLGTIALATNAISSGTCQSVTPGSVNSVAATGVASTDIIEWTPQVSLQTVTGYGVSTSGALSIDVYPTSGYVNVNVCNWTSGTITPAALTLNARVLR